MKEINFDEEHRSCIDKILNESWETFKRQFVWQTIMSEARNEAAFQFCFASIIKEIGNRYVKSDEAFFVDLETKIEVGADIISKYHDYNISKWKFIDITCGFKVGDNIKYKCAIELKCPIAGNTKHTAFPHTMYRIYRDLMYLEIESKNSLDDISEGRFYLMTNDVHYTNKPAYAEKAKTDSTYKPFGLLDPLNSESRINSTEKGEVCYHPAKEGWQIRKIKLDNSYEINWEKAKIQGKQEIENWYFLEIKIPQKSE